eukprot:11153993-Heterocapsa_arctica.AAC.1
MKLEALIAEHRQAVPYSKAKPSVESLAYLGLLGQLFKQFISAGGSNPLQENRADLLKAKVPLQKGATKSDRKLRPRRDDVKWVNSACQAWVHAQGVATDAEKINKRSQLFAQWAAMTEIERSRAVGAIAHWPADHVVGPPPEAQDDEPGVGQRRDSGWQYSDERWPVSPAILESFLGKSSG